MATVRVKKVLNLAGAEAVMSAAEAFAREKAYRVVIAIVDPEGHPILVKRLPNTQVASVQVGIDKARTAAIFVRASRALEAQVSSGRLGALALHGGVALTGGVPLVVDGEVVGAIGASGETPDEDESVSIAGTQADFSVDEVYALTYQGARIVAHIAGAVATARAVAPVISVVDASGELLYLWRPAKAQVASVQVATDKARTAAIFRRPSKDFEDQASQGRPSALALAGGVALQGGMPILHKGQVIGAIGVSGASSAPEDQELATLGAEAAEGFTTESINAATYIRAADVAAKFQKGGLLVNTDFYKVDAGRREKPGEVEWHARDTDIMYVVEGNATVVTAGEMANSRHTLPGEIRADSIKDGVTHKLSPGDVLVIPNGLPHQFVEVSNPFLYYVVKALD
jgi:glc operon protein GlcG